MIVGANGCGKTTIIEGLKYATTGCLPPGARAGHSFVNDPGVTDTPEVKAQIKLRFNNSAGMYVYVYVYVYVRTIFQLTLILTPSLLLLVDYGIYNVFITYTYTHLHLHL
jgi:hypothetical protein